VLSIEPDTRDSTINQLKIIPNPPKLVFKRGGEINK
jgi:hypothetical protein